MHLTTTAGPLTEGALIDATTRVLRTILVFLLSLLLSMAAPLPAAIQRIDNRLNSEDLGYFLWERSNRGQFWEIETGKTPVGLKRLQDASGMTEVMRLSENTWLRPSLHDLQTSKLPMAGLKTLRGYTFAFALALMAEPASAKIGRGGVGGLPNNLCPFGTGAADNGCSNSPGGNFQVANFFTGYTGTSYPSRPSFNVIGVDYKGGVPTTANPAYTFTLGGITVVGACGGTLQDPKTATTGGTDDPGCGVMPAHCAYTEPTLSASLVLPTITCASTANDIVLRGFNLAATGGHNSTYYVFNNTATGRKVIAYNNLEADPATYARNGLASFGSGSQGNTVFFANNVFGHWVDSYSTVGTGTCSFAGTAMTCTGDSGFALGQAVDATGILNSPVIVSINGGGSYTVNVSQSSLSARTTRGLYIMGGGMGFNTTGSVIVEYNAFTQNNGRDISTLPNTTIPGTALTIVDSLNKWNFYEGALYGNFSFLSQVHFETIEWELANAAHPVTYTNFDQSGNVCYVPTIAGSVTACFWNDTGAISPTPTGVDFLVSYINMTVDKNVAVANIAGTQVLTGIGSDSRPAGGPVTNYTLTNNWIHKNASGTYSGCSGNPYLVGNTGQPVSFVTASSNASTNKWTVTLFAGGTTIIADGTNFVSESHQLILSQDSSTEPGGALGKAGIYSTSGGLTLGSRGMRSAYPEILNAPTVSGNIDLPSGSPISTANMILRSDSLHPCVYAGMQ